MNKYVLSSNRNKRGGFSLIELVVVVAVLSILASIAIPAFTDMNDNAMQVAAKNSIAQIIKECAVKKAMGDANPLFNVPSLRGYTVYPSGGSCDGDSNGRIGALMSLVNSGASMPSVIEYNVVTGLKRCLPGSNISWCPPPGTW